MKKPLAFFSALLVLACAVTVSAATGSMDDPLITRDYLHGAFAESIRGDISTGYETAIAGAMGRLDELYRTYVGYSFTPKYIHVALAPGETVSLSSGGSFVLLSGSASLAVRSGTVINVSNGTEAAPGSGLALYQRYFCTENTTMVVTADTSATAQLDGYYMTNSDTAVAPQGVFKDVFESDWFFAAVDYVYNNGLFAGTSADTFSPGTPMTRGMFVTVLHRLDGTPGAGSGGFSDVASPSAYYFDAVAWACANGVVNGYSDGTFRPDRPVTREEMAAIMHRYASYRGRNMLAHGDVYDTFADTGEVSSYAEAAMRWAVTHEVIRGANGRLLPRNTATRAEVAQIIYNYCESVG